PASHAPLACLRVLVSLLLLVQALILNRWVVDFLSRDGLIQGPLSDLLRNPYLPHVGWFADAVAPLGVTEVQTLYAICLLYLLSLAFLAVGFMTRTAAIATWFLHWVLVITGYTSAYGVDLYAHVFLFYMMFMPLGKAYSLDTYFSGERLSGAPSSAARLSLRVIQFQLCISYFFSAYEKLLGEQWQTGEVLWRMFNLPFFKYFNLAWTAQWPTLLFIGAWSTIILEGLDYYVSDRMVEALQEPWTAGLSIFPYSEHYYEKELTKFFEYMAAGLPMIVSDFPNWRAIVESSECGFAVDPARLDEAVDRINWLQANPATRQAIGANGREAVETRYSW
ncbi:glycosyltransferase, partial [bacterium]